MQENNKFAEYLTDGETILWQGEGKPTDIGRLKAAVVMWLVITALLFLAMLINDGLIALIMLPFAAVGIFAARLVFGTPAVYSYAFTDRRLIWLNNSTNKFDCEFFENVSGVHIYARGKNGFEVVFFCANRNNALSRRSFSNIEKQDADTVIGLAEKYMERKE